MKKIQRQRVRFKFEIFFETKKMLTNLNEKKKYINFKIMGF